MQHLEDHGLLTNCQNSFTAEHSCKAQLLTLDNELLQGVAKRKQYELAIMDLSKAFDVVPLKLLLKKLQYYGIKGPYLDWIEEFLKKGSNRWCMPRRNSGNI